MATQSSGFCCSSSNSSCSSTETEGEETEVTKRNIETNAMNDEQPPTMTASLPTFLIEESEKFDFRKGNECQVSGTCCSSSRSSSCSTETEEEVEEEEDEEATKPTTKTNAMEENEQPTVATAPSVSTYLIEGSEYRDFSQMNASQVKAILKSTFAITKKSKKPRKGPRGGVAEPFSMKLFELLSSPSLSNYQIQWEEPHGRCFRIRDETAFVDRLLKPDTKIASFYRQLHLWGFKQLHNREGGSALYYHELFLRGRPDLCALILQQSIKKQTSKNNNTKQKELLQVTFAQLPHCQEEEHLKSESFPPATAPHRKSASHTEHTASPSLATVAARPTLERRQNNSSTPELVGSNPLDQRVNPITAVVVLFPNQKRHFPPERNPITTATVVPMSLHQQPHKLTKHQSEQNFLRQRQKQSLSQEEDGENRIDEQCHNIEAGAKFRMQSKEQEFLFGLADASQRQCASQQQQEQQQPQQAFASEFSSTPGPPLFLSLPPLQLEHHHHSKRKQQQQQRHHHNDDDDNAARRLSLANFDRSTSVAAPAAASLHRQPSNASIQSLLLSLSNNSSRRGTPNTANSIMSAKQRHHFHQSDLLLGQQPLQNSLLLPQQQLQFLPNAQNDAGRTRKNDKNSPWKSSIPKPAKQDEDGVENKEKRKRNSEQDAGDSSFMVRALRNVQPRTCSSGTRSHHLFRTSTSNNHPRIVYNDAPLQQPYAFKHFNLLGRAHHAQHLFSCFATPQRRYTFSATLCRNVYPVAYYQTVKKNTSMTTATDVTKEGKQRLVSQTQKGTVANKT